MKCISCGKQISDSAKFCKYCGNNVVVTNTQTKVRRNYSYDEKVKEIQELIKEKEKEKKQSAYTIESEERNEDLDSLVVKLDIRCPYCRSDSYHYEKKGFSVGKAVVGVALVGTVGILGGAAGSNNRVRVCDRCGKQF